MLDQRLQGLLRKPLDGVGLDLLVKLFAPERNRQRALWFIPVLQWAMTKNKYPPTYLTPVSYLFQAYCYAGEFELAACYAAEYKDLRVKADKMMMDTTSFLTHVRQRLPAHDGVLSTIKLDLYKQIVGWVNSRT